MSFLTGSFREYSEETKTLLQETYFNKINAVIIADRSSVIEKRKALLKSADEVTEKHICQFLMERQISPDCREYSKKIMLEDAQAAEDISFSKTHPDLI